MYTNSRLLLFTRYPEAGKTKTRLIAQLGADGAALLQKRLTERVVVQAQLLAKRCGTETIVHYSGGSGEKLTSWLGPVRCVAQTTGDLGQRMCAAFTHSFAEGAQTAVLIGSDIPDINEGLLHQAFLCLLGTKEVVIGPSADGGYYLIGLVARQATRLLPVLFDQMVWSSADLFGVTMDRLRQAGYDAAALPVLQDIDLPADLSLAKARGLL
ncbi:TIGR04282 family arsenosugar biosynthesis glycosyltransferase [Desulfocastanea catecholica]